MRGGFGVRAGLLAFVGWLAVASCPAASAVASTTSYSSGTANVDGVVNGPWNTSQGDTSAGSTFWGGATGTTSDAPDLFPTYLATPYSAGGPWTTLGGVQEPNLAVYPGTGSTPYPSGVAGTPGPLDGYCSSLGANPETGSNVNEPAGTDLPFAPYYFPDIVMNADGSLTGYFDWRPKDGDEGILVGKSTDSGKTWVTEGMALEQNNGYCPTADTNDDGQGHPFPLTIGSNSYLYTLQRADGDNIGVGLAVHQISPSSSNPLSGLQATEPVGVDPNTFATSAVPIPQTGSTGVAIAVSTLGVPPSPSSVNGIGVTGPDQIQATTAAPAIFVDYTVQSPTDGSKPTQITCTGTATSPNELTGCTSNVTSGSFPVGSGDDLVAVIGQVTNSSATTIPSGPNNPGGTAGAGFNYYSSKNGSETPYISGVLDNNWPGRLYIDGQTVYCTAATVTGVPGSTTPPPTPPATGNADSLSGCTTTGNPIVLAGGTDAITSDPVDPPTAQVTTGLISPDGIDGVLPTSPGHTLTGPNGTSIPAGPTALIYTEKLLNYYIVGTINGYVSGGTFTAATGGSKDKFQLGTSTLNITGIDIAPPLGESEQLPASGSFTIYVGTSSQPPGTSATDNLPIQAITCTGYTSSASTISSTAAPAGSIELTGCNTGTSSGTTGYVSLGADVGGPNAAVTPYSVLAQVGEGKNGKSSGPATLYGNNEDYEVLREAYTTDGINFTDVGAISGNDDAAGSSSSSGEDNGGYDDLTNPNQQQSPTTSGGTTGCTTTCTSPQNLAPGTTDKIELRWPGARGTIIINPDGSYGMFLSGAWANDGDSDAYNQIFYTSSTDGVHWTAPVVVSSTDYTFSASAAQDANGGRLGVSAYYSGRDYDPTVVQNPDGSLTMVFAGYRIPKTISSVGTVLGTNSSAPYTIGADDPALYRNILSAKLTSSSSPLVGSSSSLASSSSTVTAGTPVTYTDTLTDPSAGNWNPTGTVTFSDGNTVICQSAPLSATSTDTATCTNTPTTSGSRPITAAYSGDSNFATSSATTNETVNPAAPTATINSPAGGGLYAQGQMVGTTVSCTEGIGGPGISTCSDNNGDTSTGDTLDGALDTSTPDSNETYSVTATSGDGETGTASIDYAVVGPPSASIDSPSSGPYVYSEGQVVGTSFHCTAGADDPAAPTCTDSDGSTSGTGSLDTSTPGTDTYSVTATSTDTTQGSVTTSISYTVVGPPSASIDSPADNGVYAVGDDVPTTFHCDSGEDEPGTTSCTDSSGSTSGTGVLDTTKAGTFTYTVTASSSDTHQSASTSISYTVVGPPSASVDSPSGGGVYGEGDSVPTQFHCTAGAFEPGVTTCVDSNGASTGPSLSGGTGSLYTSAPGSDVSYTLTATSQDTDNPPGTDSISYTVAGPPTVTISPGSGGTYTVGQHVPTTFSCAGTDDPAPPTCVDSNGSTSGSGTLDTTTPGSHTYSVTATSTDTDLPPVTKTINYTVAGAPGASITTPSDNAIYAVGQTVDANYQCTADSADPISSCTDSQGVGDGNPIETGAPGSYTFTVTATTVLGQVASQTVTYAVASAPTAAISAPQDNHTYAQGQVVDTSFSCSDSRYGSGISSCMDSNDATGGAGILNTQSLGAHTYTVTATSYDGQTYTATLHYEVVGSPTATITKPPAGGGFYTQSMTVPTSFSCAAGTDDPDAPACRDSSGSTSGTGSLDTSTLGPQTYTVTATSPDSDGPPVTASITYTVVGRPTVTISSPASGGTYGQNQSVPTSFACSAGAYDPATPTCKDSNGSTSGTGSLNTNTLGSHTYTVTATSPDSNGSSVTKSISYTVVAAPTNTGPPTVSGPAQDGRTLLAHNGAWMSPVTPKTLTYSYHWLRCTSGTCSKIANATAATYLQTSADVGHEIEVAVTATDVNGQFATADSAETHQVADPPPPGPMAAPAISGSTVDGDKLTTTNGTWKSPDTLEYGYQWQRCNAGGGGCTNIGGATSSSYVLTSGDEMHKITVVVTATDAEGQTGHNAAKPVGPVTA